MVLKEKNNVIYPYKELIDTSMGTIIVHWKNNLQLTSLKFSSTITGRTTTSSEFALQINKVMDNPGYVINIPEFYIDLSSGTEFQRKVWEEMIKIPAGKVATYSEIAERIGKPTAYRAVANACGANPVVVLVPCHRVVAKSGLGGFSAGIEIKKELLRREGYLK